MVVQNQVKLELTKSHESVKDSAQKVVSEKVDIIKKHYEIINKISVSQPQLEHKGHLNSN